MADDKKPTASDKPGEPEAKTAAEKPAAHAGAKQASENKSGAAETRPEKSAAPAGGKPATDGTSSTKAGKSTKKKPVKTNLSDEQIKAADAVVKKKMTIEEEKRALDEIITGDSTAAEKKEAIARLMELGADVDILKKKHVDPDKTKGVEEIKKRASAAKRILEQGYVSDADVHLERLADTFDKSARRWEMVVYPTMFAFILLAGYGFYLIYHLTHDIAVLSHSVTRMATIVSDATPKVTTDMRNMSSDMQNMSGELNKMSFQMETLKPMSNNIGTMTYTMHSLNRSVYGMQRDLGGMNRTVSGGPFGFMNDAMPFTSDSYKNPPPPLPQLPMYGPQGPVYVQPSQMMQQQPMQQQPMQQPQDTGQQQAPADDSSSIFIRNN